MRDIANKRDQLEATVCKITDIDDIGDLWDGTKV